MATIRLKAFDNITADTVVNAMYKTNFYTVTFVTDGNGSLTGQTVHTVPAGTSWTELEIPETTANKGFKFSHWSVGEPDAATGDITVTAIFVKDEDQYFDVTFIAGEHGTLNGTASYTDIIIDTTWSEIAVPVPEAEYGYKFAGWDITFPKRITSDVVATALFVKDESLWHTVRFTSSANGYLAGTTVYTEILNGTSFAEIAVPTPIAAEGYVFTEWAPSFPETIEGDHTFTASFKSVSELPIVLDITNAYYEDGKITVVGTTENVVDQWDVAIKVTAADKTVTFITVKYGDINTGNGTFKHTFTVNPADISGDVYVDMKLVTVPVPADREPVDYDLYTVKFTSTAGGYLAGNAVYSGILEGSAWADVISAVPTPIPAEGYTFIGWDKAFVDTVDSDMVYVARFEKAVVMPFDITEAIYNPATGKLTVEGYAEDAQDQWNVAFMTYANVDSVENITSETLVNVTTLKYGDIKTDANDGHFVAEFAVYGAALEGKVYVSGKYVEVESEPDAERVKTYLYFDKNAADAIDGATTETLLYIGDDINSALTTDYPTRANYEFVEWAADRVGTSIPEGTVMTGAGYTAYAKWRESTVIVTFKDYDGTILKAESVPYGGAATAPADPAREGYYFAGWDKGFSNVTENITVTATYVRYRFEAPKQWYIVNEPLADNHKLYRILEDGTEQLIDKALYTVEALPTTADTAYADCLGWHELGVVFDDTLYGVVYETAFDAFVIPDKLILEEESPLERKDKYNLDKDYRADITDAIEYEMIFGLKERQEVQTLIDEFINMYFINYYTDPSEIDYEVRIVNEDGSAFKSLYVCTGARVQLVIEGVVYDEVQVVVLGDVDGNGIVNDGDLECICNYRIGLKRPDGVYYLAADTASEQELNEADMEIIRNFRIGVGNMYAAWDAASHVYSRDYSERFANIPSAIAP